MMCDAHSGCQGAWAQPRPPPVRPCSLLPVVNVLDTNSDKVDGCISNPSPLHPGRHPLLRGPPCGAAQGLGHAAAGLGHRILNGAIGAWQGLPVVVLVALEVLPWPARPGPAHARYTMPLHFFSCCCVVAMGAGWPRQPSMVPSPLHGPRPVPYHLRSSFRAHCNSFRHRRCAGPIAADPPP